MSGLKLDLPLKNRLSKLLISVMGMLRHLTSNGRWRIVREQLYQ
jgi:hypothetical protein